MEAKAYLDSYIEQSKIEIKREENPEWMRSFFKDFSETLDLKRKKSSSGDRYVVTSSFRKAFKQLVPSGLEWKPEIQFSELMEISEETEVGKMLRRKRIDYAVFCADKTVLIEFKTNLQFNDVSAAMVEMSLVKKFERKPSIKPFETWSLHLFPSANISGLEEMNKMLGSPLNKIWIFCKESKNVEFDISEIENFRKELKSQNELVVN